MRDDSKMFFFLLISAAYRPFRDLNMCVNCQPTTKLQYWLCDRFSLIIFVLSSPVNARINSTYVPSIPYHSIPFGQSIGFYIKKLLSSNKNIFRNDRTWALLIRDGNIYIFYWTSNCNINDNEKFFYYYYSLKDRSFLLPCMNTFFLIPHSSSSSSSSIRKEEENTKMIMMMTKSSNVEEAHWRWPSSSYHHRHVIFFYYFLPDNQFKLFLASATATLSRRQ